MRKSKISTCLIYRSYVRTKNTRKSREDHNRMNIHSNEEKGEDSALFYPGRNSLQSASRFQLVSNEPLPLDRIL